MHYTLHSSLTECAEELEAAVSRLTSPLALARRAASFFDWSIATAETQPRYRTHSSSSSKPDASSILAIESPGHITTPDEGFGRFRPSLVRNFIDALLASSLAVPADLGPHLWQQSENVASIIIISLSSRRLESCGNFTFTKDINIYSLKAFRAVLQNASQYAGHSGHCLAVHQNDD